MKLECYTCHKRFGNFLYARNHMLKHDHALATKTGSVRYVRDNGKIHVEPVVLLDDALEAFVERPDLPSNDDIFAKLGLPEELRPRKAALTL